MMKWTWINGMLFFFGMILMMACADTRTSGRDFTVNKRGSRTYQKKRSSESTKPRSNRTIAKSSRKPSSTTGSKKPRSSASERSGTSKAIAQDRTNIVGLAKTFQGSPYKYGGKTPESGFDCSGLVYYTYRHYNYGMVAGSANQAKLGERISIKNVEIGDLLFFGNNSRVSHVGIVSFHEGEVLKMVHSSSSRGVVEDQINNSTYWKSRFLYARNVIDGLDASGKAEK